MSEVPWYARNAKRTGDRLTHKHSGQRRGPRKCWRPSGGWTRPVLDLTGAAWVLALWFGHKAQTVTDS
ncbi:hypothetical protein MGG_17741 [Pyricularia oryzae 70-15]|uniref:Uncharacterized protein n=4 Tax=Pyricularia oryzae TaxID=318829 RepID=G4NHH3_PYRO7|nr:uncharacterized protein MGG_17741 [Pyricularia oryzae 70-15]ELQ44490.1 hypothetical protein OOU_Y34scaffold00085g6 [Pyricularia oryzae Y34]KAI6417718.1 hypothetical protein MCOR20_000210 [Pyricularia oryzae]EHA47683.1 hypothetical protein MGG_17741 [Pyricularia oryzae 70-15]KAI7924759.1 hypothetical protein M9X92_003661 [Pyricularia oryzae]KAI7931942.1 hypothetical protein M0657_000956 [Pyricularia oryzae]